MLKKIKLVLKSVRQYKKYAIITPIFMMGEAAMECVLPFFMAMFIDTVDNIESINDLVKWFQYPKLHIYVSILALIIAMIVLATLSMLFGILGGRFAAKASVGLATNLRKDLYNKIQTFSFSNIDKFSTSSLVTRLTTDVNNVQMAFQMTIRIVVRAPLMLIFSAVMSFISGGFMAMIFVVLIPIIVVGLLLIAVNAMKIFKRVFRRYDVLNESVQENVSGIRVVKAYVREEFEKIKFGNASDSMSNDFIKAEKIVALNNPLMNTSIHLSNILVIGIGSYFINRSVSNVTFSEIKGQVISNIEYNAPGFKLTPGQLSSLMTYGIQILSNLMMISMILVMLVMSLEAIRRISEVLEEIPTINNCENPIYELKDGSVDFNDVDFKYSEKAEKNTLEDINLHIKSGQFVGILGSTGSGKTSVVNLISRLYDITSGTLLVGGNNVKDYDLNSLRNEVSVVLQKNVLFSGTVASNLQWGNENASEEEMWEALRIAQCDENIKAKPDGLYSKVEQGGNNFSGGQKQRLCIARAILKRPKILILDDSTSAVDTKTDRFIRKGLIEKLPNMTKIVIAQRISSIENADQIVILDNGHIDAVGTHVELLKTNKIYQEVYYTQNKVGGDTHAAN